MLHLEKGDNHFTHLKVRRLNEATDIKIQYSTWLLEVILAITIILAMMLMLMQP